MTNIESLKEFDIVNSSLNLWVFKKSTRDGNIVFTGRWVDIESDLENALKKSFLEEIASKTEELEYGTLAQNNEGSVLTLGIDQTKAELIVDQVKDPVDKLKVRKNKDIQNTAFYVVKYVDGEKSLIAVTKTDSSWRAKKRFEFIDVVLKNERLSLDVDPGYNISKRIDFVIFGQKV